MYLKNNIGEMVAYENNMDAVSWGYQNGIIISGNDAQLIVDLIERGAEHQARQQPSLSELRKTLDESELWQQVFELNQASYATNDPLEHEVMKAKAIAELLEAKAVEPQQGWVDVKDRLPEVQTATDGVFKNEQLSVLQFTLYDSLEFGVWDGKKWEIPDRGFFAKNTVTHWMNLPPKPTTNN